MRLTTVVTGAAAAGALIVGVVLGANLFTAGNSASVNGDAALAASAASPSASPAAGARQFHPNEDPAHEKSESAAREAQEKSGQFPGGAFRPNEDPTHEKSESAPREAQENLGLTGATH